MSSTFTGNSPETFDAVYQRIKTFPTPLLPPGKAHDPKMTDRISSLYLHPSKQPPSSPLSPLSPPSDLLSNPPFPALEALLHILNLDLPSAHFLVRHMQAAPQWEGMYIHGLLHRVEGDYNNCRAWYADVCPCKAFTSFYGSSATDLPASLSFLASESDLSSLAGSDDDLSPAPTAEQPKSKDPNSDGPRLMYGPGGGKVPSQTSARAFISAIEKLRRTSASSSGYAARRTDLERASRAEIEALVDFCAEKYGTGKVRDASGVWVQPGEEHRAMGEKMVTGGEGWRKF
ncbi:hypothetical protein CAC42_1367 [Sphaceloma murrayae]|uniref:Uncharacterized protein n=1 Tax=Sphaceloma murrayae TaxID=2082308 RepID=A0A2K1QFJ4_9PEZI|nr:hypothetical protein CAC42_1367 [Sphaceloma murrayae]